MKKFLKIPAFLVLLLAGSLLSGCVASAGLGYSDYGYGYTPRVYARPYYRPYARPYYRPYYRPAPTVIVQPRPRVAYPAPRHDQFRNNNVRPHRSTRVR